MTSLEKLSKMVSEFVMSNFSEVLEQERARHEERYNLKLGEMTAMQDVIDELNDKVDNLTNVVKGLEDDKSDLEREVLAKEKEITRLEAESDSMKAFMKQSLNL
jgi:predicted  nucleic acid-binding Zn-ribbon protein